MFDETIHRNVCVWCVYVNVVAGCMDAIAENFNADATQDDGSCTYPGGASSCYRRNVLMYIWDTIDLCICIGRAILIAYCLRH